jgi:cell division protein FtsN
MSYLERKDCSVPTKIQEEPQAILGVAGIAAALVVFLFVGGWKPRITNAQTMNAQSDKEANRNSLYSVAEKSNSLSGSSMLSARNSQDPIASREVDLYADLKNDNAKPELPSPAAPSDAVMSSDRTLPNQKLSSETSAVPATSAKPPQIADRAKSAVRTEQRKAQVKTQNGPQLQELTTSAPPENIAPVDSAKSLPVEPAATSTQPASSSEAAMGQANTASKANTTGSEAKAPQLYFEVGNFKDETWASSAVDKLTQLGFHAVIIHKNLLWSQSYHVQVGPYTSKEDIAEARQSLAAQGFKAHAVN